jgi:hypothetical protein
MHNSTWQQTETELWSQLMYPPRRKVTLHSIPKTASGKRKQVLQQIDKRKKQEWSDGWRSLHLFLQH